MTATKDFPISAVLSVVTGKLMGGIDGVYDVLNWMTGESLMTHQLPRVCDEAEPVLRAMYPALAQACEEATRVDRENWAVWLTIWTERYGSTLAVPKLNADQHERIDPMSELVEKVHPGKIIAVQL